MCDSGFLLGPVLPVIDQCALKMVEGGDPFLAREIDEPHAIIGVGLLVVATKGKHLRVEGQGAVVLSQVEMALGIGKTVERQFLRSE